MTRSPVASRHATTRPSREIMPTRASTDVSFVLVDRGQQPSALGWIIDQAGVLGSEDGIKITRVDLWHVYILHIPPCTPTLSLRQRRCNARAGLLRAGYAKRQCTCLALQRATSRHPSQTGRCWPASLSQNRAPPQRRLAKHALPPAQTPPPPT